MRKGIFIALALCAALCSPTMARADDINYLDSFASGIDTLRGETVNETVQPESEYIESYEPTLGEPLGAPATTETDGEVSLLGNITNTVNAYQTIPVGAYQFTPVRYLVWLFTNTAVGGIVTIAVGLVFLWWGVRKAKNIIVTAFRSGRLSFGSVDRNPNSYYYGTRPSDWR